MHLLAAMFLWIDGTAYWITLLKIVWGITGSGDHLDEILDIIDELHTDERIKIRVLVSKAGEQVLRWYDLWEGLGNRVQKVQVETNANVPFLAGPLQLGKYDLLVVAPLTANSTAKIAHGIADTLITNAVAQTLKGPTKVVLYPVDQQLGKIPAVGPNGEAFKVHVRGVDSHNVEQLRRMRNVIVVPTPAQIRDHVYSLAARMSDS